MSNHGGPRLGAGRPPLLTPSQRGAAGALCEGIRERHGDGRSAFGRPRITVLEDVRCTLRELLGIRVSVHTIKNCWDEHRRKAA
jgi:hypothetical protein